MITCSRSCTALCCKKARLRFSLFVICRITTSNFYRSAGQLARLVSGYKDNWKDYPQCILAPALLKTINVQSFTKKKLATMTSADFSARSINEYGDFPPSRFLLLKHCGSPPGRALSFLRQESFRNPGNCILFPSIPAGSTSKSMTTLELWYVGLGPTFGLTQTSQPHIRFL